MKAAEGMKVKAYTGRCIGIIIEATTWQGTITKVNKKSIRVNLNEMTSTFGKQIKSHHSANETVRYTYWKTTSDGREIYKSELNGIIEL